MRRGRVEEGFVTLLHFKSQYTYNVELLLGMQPLRVTLNRFRHYLTGHKPTYEIAKM